MCVIGDEVSAMSSLAPKVGPLGLSSKKVGEESAKETTKEWKVSIVPSATALVIKALKEPERDCKKTKNNKHIARIMRPRSMVKNLSETMKEILDTCVSVGCMVNGKNPKDLQQEITDDNVETPQD
uniref:Large ribosomal subunit protein uL11 C-terminal domain-containing protein n=1 Tax=Nelumbo nucifera TaxID=4432 RepID=A0A822Z2M6_NELNU|nr:TPA_asm: hypothetical protein HUJ06_013605 [Nelumbo nucifera]